MGEQSGSFRDGKTDLNYSNYLLVGNHKFDFNSEILHHINSKLKAHFYETLKINKCKYKSNLLNNINNKILA